MAEASDQLCNSQFARLPVWQLFINGAECRDQQLGPNQVNRNWARVAVTLIIGFAAVASAGGP